MLVGRDFSAAQKDVSGEQAWNGSLLAVFNGKCFHCPAFQSPLTPIVNIDVEKFVFHVKDKKIVRTKEMIPYEYVS